MSQKISKCVFYIISFLLIYIAIIKIKNIDFDGIIFIFAFAICTNPFIIDKIFAKIGVEESDYFYGLKMLLIWGGILFAYIISIVVFNILNIGDKDSAFQNFEAIFKIAVFSIYLITLFICKSNDKFFKYMIFGFFYMLCVILSFSTDSINNLIISILNLIPDSSLDMASYTILVNDFLIPIKEAILTYIIFDTVIENHHKQVDENKILIKENNEQFNDNVIKENVYIDNTYNVNVFDNNLMKNTSFKIKVKKR